MSNAEQILKDAGVIMNGHFLLSSGRHSPIYWEKFQVLQWPEHTQALCKMIADHYRSQNIQVVAGPTTGGIILAFEVARQLGVRGIFAERTTEKQRAFKRGFKIKPGERVLIVDDVMTTGGSINEVIPPVKAANGNIIGIGILVDRSDKPVDFGYPFFACHRAPPPPTYASDDCPLCAAGIPLVKPGSS
jgi:orotate phosphoribosyltransferase